MVALLVDIPDDVHEKLERLARERGVTAADVLRQEAQRIAAAAGTTHGAPQPRERRPLPVLDLGPPLVPDDRLWEFGNEGAGPDAGEGLVR